MRLSGPLPAQALERPGVEQEQRALGQHRLPAGIAEIVEQRQEHERDVAAAREQPLEIGRQLHHRARERLDAGIDVCATRCVNRAAGLLHLLGEQGGAVNLDDLERSGREVQQARGAHERLRIGLAVDEILDLAARGLERRGKLAIDEVERLAGKLVHRQGSLSSEP